MNGHHPRISDLLESPVVGQVYFVPCGINRIGDSFPLLDIPAHIDNDYFLPDSPLLRTEKHYHHDFRFWEDKAFELIRQRSDKEKINIFGYVAPVRNYPVVEWMPKACCREMPEWNCRVIRRFQDDYRYRFIKACPDRQPVCPHRGCSLRGLKQDARCVVRCPAHGLKWNLRSGRAEV
jgi:hypothetical protein